MSSFRKGAQRMKNEHALPETVENGLGRASAVFSRMPDFPRE
jgi:hypothetical protein